MNNDFQDRQAVDWLDDYRGARFVVIVMLIILAMIAIFEWNTARLRSDFEHQHRAILEQPHD